ncbi:hypothetical protein KR032_003898 [Drosophila birchii]|nr:hypothetical protein KR032_003898 [Drosophila birchii]
MIGLMQLPHYVLIVVSTFATMQAQLQQQQQQQPGISYHNSWLYSMPWRPLILPTVARLPSLPGASQLSPGYTGPQTFPPAQQDQQQQQQRQIPFHQQQQNPYQQQQQQNPYQQQQEQQQNPYQQQQQQNLYQQQQEQQQNPYQQQQQQYPFQQQQQQQSPYQQQQNPFQQQQQQHPSQQYPSQQYPSQQSVLLGLFTPQLQVHPLAAPPPQAGHFSLPFRPSPFAGYTEDEEENQVEGNHHQQQQQQQQQLEEPPFHAHPYKPVAEASELSRGAAGGGYVYLSPSNLYNLVRS